MVQVRLSVDDIQLVLDYYDTIVLEASATQTGLYAELTRVTLDDGRSVYYYDHTDGTGGTWYRTRYYKVSTGVYSEYSIAFQGAAAEKVGWSFGNYEPKPGQWGHLLTPDDIRYTYMWGIDLQASNGEYYTDDQIEFNVRSSIRELERALNLTVMKRKIVSAPDDISNVDDYDEIEDAYYYRRDKFNRMGRVNLRRRPIISVERFDLHTITDQKIFDLLPWTRISHKKGVLHFFPKASGDGSMRVSPSFLVMGLSSFSGNYAGGYKIEYTAGYPSAKQVPEDLRDIIGKIATVKLLNIVGDGFIAGFSSSSLSMDGISESFSSTQSATNAYFGARIQVYLKDIESYIKDNRNKFGFQIVGSV